MLVLSNTSLFEGALSRNNGDCFTHGQCEFLSWKEKASGILYFIALSVEHTHSSISSESGKPSPSKTFTVYCMISDVVGEGMIERINGLVK